MNEPVMIGTRGWNHVSGGDFYPTELPDDWRFCYYSNNLRSVLVPQEVWDSAQRADVRQWLEDSDPAFRFVLEIPAKLGVALNPAQTDRGIEKFLETVEPVVPRTAGFLLRIAPATPVAFDGFEHLLNSLADLAPVCTDLPDGPWRAPAVYAVLERQGTGLVWHCAHEAAPRPGGRLRLALAPPTPPRAVRRWIEQLAQWQDQDALGRKTAPAFPALPPSLAVAGLFFDAPAGAAKAAQEARLIAELMGV